MKKSKSKGKHSIPRENSFELLLGSIATRLQQFLTLLPGGVQLIKTARLFSQAWQRFRADHGSIRSSAIAYSIAFSIIPLLTILIRYANVDRNLIQSNIARFMTAYGMSDSTEILIFLNEILERSYSLAELGIFVMILSVVNLIFQLENSFNYIFRTPANRPLLFRLGIYISALTLLPILLLLIGGTFRTVVNTLQPPKLTASNTLSNQIVIIGSDGQLRLRRGKKTKFIDLKEKVALNSSRIPLLFDLESKVELKATDPEHRNTAIRPDAEDFSQLHRIAIQNNSIYLISKTGLLLFSHDEGVTWSFESIRVKAAGRVITPLLEDLELLSDGRLLIVATLGSHSSLIEKDQKRWRIKSLARTYYGIYSYTAAQTTAARAGLYLSGNGYYLHSADNGRTWSPAQEAAYGQRKLKINYLFADPGGKLFFTGPAGALWDSSGEIYNNLRLPHGSELRGIYFKRDGAGFVYGSNGIFRYTPNHGESWHLLNTNRFEDFDLNAHLALADQTILLVGSEELTLNLGWPNLIKERDESGHRLASFNLISSDAYPFLKSLLQQLFLFLIIFSIVLLVFVTGYRYLPNTEVKWKPAIAGGIITSAALVIFILLFRFWIINFPSGTVFVYGIWAVVPVGMIIILISTQITLFGLELAYIIQHPTYHSTQEERPDLAAYSFWDNTLLTTLVYHYLYQLKQPLSGAAALPHFRFDIRALQAAQKNLAVNQLVNYDPQRDEYLPTRAPTEVTLKEIQELSFMNLMALPDSRLPSGYHRQLERFYRENSSHLTKSKSKLTIAVLLKNLPADFK